MSSLRDIALAAILTVLVLESNTFQQVLAPIMAPRIDYSVGGPDLQPVPTVPPYDGGSSGCDSFEIDEDTSPYHIPFEGERIAI